MAFHVANAWEEGSTIRLFLCCMKDFRWVVQMLECLTVCSPKDFRGGGGGQAGGRGGGGVGGDAIWLCKSLGAWMPVLLLLCERELQC
jgi:hypothetical protein